MIRNTFFCTDGPPLDFTNKEIKKIEGRDYKIWKTNNRSQDSLVTQRQIFRLPTQQKTVFLLEKETIAQMKMKEKVEKDY